jgi:hypothetical protein
MLRVGGIEPCCVEATVSAHLLVEWADCQIECASEGSPNSTGAHESPFHMVNIAKFGASANSGFPFMPLNQRLRQ